MITLKNYQEEIITTEIVKKIQFWMNLVLGVATVATIIAVYIGAISLVSISVIAVAVGYTIGTLIVFAMDAYCLLKKTVINLANEVYCLLKKTVINLANEVYGNVINSSYAVKTTVVKIVDVAKTTVVKTVDLVKSGFNKLCSWFCYQQFLRS